MNFENHHYIKYLCKHGSVEKLWECGICQRDFKNLFLLKKHLTSHTDERKHICKICFRAFRQIATLNQHYAIHSTLRPFVCKICNKSFGRLSTLISHRKIHNDEKSYKCHICSKAFHQKGNLRNHLFYHTNARPYLCKLCNRGYNQQSNLVCHIKKMHKEIDTKYKMRKLTSNRNLPEFSYITEKNMPAEFNNIELYKYLIINSNENNKNLKDDTSFIVLKINGTKTSIMKIVSVNNDDKDKIFLPVTRSELKKYGKFVEKDDGYMFEIPIVGIIGITITDDVCDIYNEPLADVGIYRS